MTNDADSASEILRITAEHVRDENYVGPDVSSWAGHIEIASNLGLVRFANIAATGSILVLPGSTIEVGGSIKAGDAIKAGGSIEDGYWIEVGDSIKAGWAIKAGDSIEAGGSIEAALSIRCKFLNVRLRIFAGLVSWRMPLPGEDEIHGELRRGTIALGKHMPPAGESAPLTAA